MMIAQKATPGARGVDTDTRLDPAACARLRAAGVQFVARYVRDVRHDELAAILGAGMAFLGVSHVRAAGWVPSAGMGTLDGMNIANAARALMLPDGATLFCDVEGVAPSCSSTDVILYVNAWHDAVAAAKYEPGLYVGAVSLLTGYQLFHYLKTTRYWRSGSNVPTPDERGYCVLQESPLDATLAGIRVDYDVIQADAYGDVPSWVRAATDTSLPPAA